MSYKYYCVDCGAHLDADEIRFDLAELTGVRHLIIGDNSSELKHHNAKLGMVRVSALLANKTDENLDTEDIRGLDGKEIEVEYDLSRYLQLMGLNYGKAQFVGRARMLSLRDLADEPSENFLCEVLGLNEDDYNTRYEISTYVQALLQVFRFTGENEQDLSCYICRFHIRPQCFTDGSGIYALEYKNSLQNGWNKIMYDGVIRGYCPECGSPVIDGCGEYEHILVGFLGAQSAGKTSTIIAMMNRIGEIFSDLEILHPAPIPLHDKRFMIARNNLKLYKKGWAVYKTDVGNDYSTFNGSLLLKSNMPNGPVKLVTFIDIAGEVLYDEEIGGIRAGSLNRYPLIDQCNLYIICSCAQTEGAEVPPDAIISIASEIYQRRNTASPMCIALTKVDQFDATESESSGQINKNGGRVRDIFANMRPSTDYSYLNHLAGFKNVYASTNNSDVKKVIDWCCKTYDNFKDRTFVTLLHTAAYGYVAKRYEQDLQNIVRSDEGDPRPSGIDELWRWVLTVIGLIETPQHYRFKVIPSRNLRPKDYGYYRALQTQFLNPLEIPQNTDRGGYGDKEDGSSGGTRIFGGLGRR